MAKVELLSPIIEKWEGGYQCYPQDTGNKNSKGELVGTNKGITPATYERAFGKCPTVDDMKSIALDQFNTVLKKFYWDHWKADQINNQSVANLLVDWCYCSGSHGIKLPQEILGVTTDGIVGDKTITSLNSQNQSQFFQKVWDRRLKFLNDIVKNNPNQSKFIKGWVNRLESFKYSE